MISTVVTAGGSRGRRKRDDGISTDAVSMRRDGAMMIMMVITTVSCGISSSTSSSIGIELAGIALSSCC